MKKVKCIVSLYTSERFFGHVYLDDGQRVQDLLNDERRFVPFEKSEVNKGPRDAEPVVFGIVINKDSIVSIEER